METNVLIETILEQYRDHFNRDVERYRNHVYRVYFLCLLMDPAHEHKDRYAIAAAFHDIGIWTNNMFDYLEPSIALARNYLEHTGKPEWTAEITQMINQHHKMSRYTGEFAVTVETFRKADWYDLSKGLVKFGLSWKRTRKMAQAFPSKGFRRFLVRKTIANFFRHPLNPLPMFKR